MSERDRRFFQEQGVEDASRRAFLKAGGALVGTMVGLEALKHFTSEQHTSSKVVSVEDKLPYGDSFGYYSEVEIVPAGKNEQEVQEMIQKGILVNVRSGSTIDSDTIGGLPLSTHIKNVNLVQGNIPDSSLYGAVWFAFEMKDIEGPVLNAHTQKPMTKEERAKVADQLGFVYYDYVTAVQPQTTP